MEEESRLDKFLKSLVDENSALYGQLTNPIITQNQLANIIDTEIEKPEAEMDADLISFCLNALLISQRGQDSTEKAKKYDEPVPEELRQLLITLKEEQLKRSKAEAETLLQQRKAERAKAQEEKEKRILESLSSVGKNGKKIIDPVTRKKRRRLRTIILVAAVFSLMTCMVVVSSAGMEPFQKIEDSIISFVDNKIRVHFDQANNEADNYTPNDINNKLLNDLKENGFDNVILPKDLLNDDWKVKGTNYSNSELANNVEISLKKGRKNSSIRLSKYNQDTDISLITEKNYVNPEDGLQLKINNLDILIFKMGKYSMINYFDINTYTYYSITIPTGQEEAVKIAESIQ